MTTDTQDQAAAPADENKIIAERRAKLAAIRDKGIAFPNDFRPQHKAADLVDRVRREDARRARSESGAGGHGRPHDAEARSGQESRRSPSCRIRPARAPTAASRSTSRSTSPAKRPWKRCTHYDLGDILGVEGTLFKTKTGELTVKVSTLRLITKSLRPLPDKFHGLADQETKYRQRYVDMIMSEETRRTFKARTAAMSSIRRFMEKHDFMEVETPMLHTIPGGAAAKPFITHHNALDMEMFLRIAPELYLKRLVVGGFDRVFEVNRNFRNEGVSPRHNPEFTMMEFYAAYTDYQWIMNFTEEVIRQAAVDAHGTAELTYGGRALDLSKPFHRMTIVEAINKFAPHYTSEQLHDMDFLKAELLKFGVKPFSTSGLGALQLSLFEETAEAQLWEPTFIIDYPAEVSPLARASDTTRRHHRALRTVHRRAAKSPTASRS